VNRDLAGQVAIVTGGASGIGYAVAQRLARDGAKVAIADVNELSLQRAVAALEAEGHCARGWTVDVADGNAVATAVAEVSDEIGPVDILVNNAGIWIVKPYVDLSDEEFNLQLRVNINGTHNFMRSVLPDMIARRTGSIVNISSSAAFSYTVPHAAYAASKAAIIVLTRDVGFEVARFGVRINCVAPGLIASENVLAGLGAKGEDTSAPSHSRPLGWGHPDDIAGSVAFLVSKDARFIVGTTMSVAGGSDLLVGMATGERGYLTQIQS
jgi:NAD(P)-dependent dehydrogenase (short-subunit alcohol dehydrogenase family)